MQLGSQQAAKLPIDTPSAARMYDYFLGGHHNFEVDRRAAERVARVYPDAYAAAKCNRAFLRRVVTFLAQQGIDQFLDLGSGIPTVGNVHQAVQAINPAAVVVYVDADPITVAHSKDLLQGSHGVTIFQADVREIELLLGQPEVSRLLDFNRPVAVLSLALLHFIPDDAAMYQIVQTIRDCLASGSYFAMSHITGEMIPPAIAAQLEHLYLGTTNPSKFRSYAQIQRCFDGFEVIPPGLVNLPLWHPEDARDLFLDEPVRSTSLGGVGRKP